MHATLARKGSCSKLVLSLLYTTMSETPSQELTGFREAFRQLTYQVFRSLYTQTGDIIQLNLLRNRVQRFSNDAATVNIFSTSAYLLLLMCYLYSTNIYFQHTSTRL